MSQPHHFHMTLSTTTMNIGNSIYGGVLALAGWVQSVGVVTLVGVFVALVGLYFQWQKNRRDRIAHELDVEIKLRKLESINEQSKSCQGTIEKD